MDGPTNVSSKMRPLKPEKKVKNTSKSISKTFVKKTKSRQLKKKQFIKAWQNLCISSIFFSLLFLFLNQVSTKIYRNQIKINGSSVIGTQEIIKITGNFFPKMLIEINPKQLESILINKLPIKAISINRRILPPELQINLILR